MITLPLRRTVKTTTGLENVEESSAHMEMIAIESENENIGSSVDCSTGIEGEIVESDDVQKSSRINADEQVMLLHTLISIYISFLPTRQ